MRPLNETMATLAVKDKDVVSDEIILRQAIIAELDAVNLYEQMARSAKNSKLKKILLDIAEEEKVHVGELEAMLNECDKEHLPAMKKGKREVKHFTEWLITKHEISDVATTT